MAKRTTSVRKTRGGVPRIFRNFISRHPVLGRAHESVAKAVEKAGPRASDKELAEAMRAPYPGVMASYDFTKDDMTGIDLSSYVFSKLVGGKFERLPFTTR